MTEANRVKTSSLDVRRSYFGPAKMPGLASDFSSEEGALVEPPGTAPGSDPLITRAIYYHSPRRDR